MECSYYWGIKMNDDDGEQFLKWGLIACALSFLIVYSITRDFNASGVAVGGSLFMLVLALMTLKYNTAAIIIKHRYLDALTTILILLLGILLVIELLPAVSALSVNATVDDKYVVLQINGEPPYKIFTDDGSYSGNLVYGDKQSLTLAEGELREITVVDATNASTTVSATPAIYNVPIFYTFCVIAAVVFAILGIRWSLLMIPSMILSTIWLSFFIQNPDLNELQAIAHTALSLTPALSLAYQELGR